jgi:hypothetical protein
MMAEKAHWLTREANAAKPLDVTSPFDIRGFNQCIEGGQQN